MGDFAWLSTLDAPISQDQVAVNIMLAGTYKQIPLLCKEGHTAEQIIRWIVTDIYKGIHGDLWTKSNQAEILQECYLWWLECPR